MIFGLPAAALGLTGYGSCSMSHARNCLTFSMFRVKLISGQDQSAMISPRTSSPSQLNLSKAMSANPMVARALGSSSSLRTASHRATAIPLVTQTPLAYLQFPRSIEYPRLVVPSPSDLSQVPLG